MNSPESSPWGFLQWAVAGLASIGASAAAFVWQLMNLDSHSGDHPSATPTRS